VVDGSTAPERQDEMKEQVRRAADAALEKKMRVLARLGADQHDGL